MGFTVGDMLMFSRDKYQMELIAGKNGWANSISWLLLAEDTTLMRNFKGKELVVTTGLGFGTTEKQLELIRILDEHHCSGLIINTGFYIKEIPQEVIDSADQHDLPLLTVPWSILMSEMIKDLTVRIFLQSQADEQISAAFIKAIERPQPDSEYRESLSSAYDVDGRFQVIAFTAQGLDTMDTMERRRIGYRLQIYLENISHNAHFFYYDGNFVLILNAVEDADRDRIMKGFLDRMSRRMTDREIHVGEGSVVTDVSKLSVAYKRAIYAARFAMKNKQLVVRFDELGMYRLLYDVSEEDLLKELGPDALEPLFAYDRKHHADLVETLELYLKHNGSITAVSEQMYIHKNTILYRMAKIRELLGCDLEDGEERMRYYMAILICREQQHPEI